MSFVGALVVYADDIVLIAPTPAPCKLLAICDDFAWQYDIVFNEKVKNFLLLLTNVILCMRIYN